MDRRHGYDIGHAKAKQKIKKVKERRWPPVSFLNLLQCLTFVVDFGTLLWRSSNAISDHLNLGGEGYLIGVK